MDIAEYHAHPALGSSRLRELLKSPAHFRANLRRETEALALGSLVHTLVLEPDTFAHRYVVTPKIDGRTREGKAAKAALADDPRIVVNEEVMADASACATSIMAHRVYQQIRDAQVEHTVFWDEEVHWEDAAGNQVVTRVPCKARFDVVGPWLVDLKTCRDASPKGFQRSIATYGYHIQAAHYWAGAVANGMEPRGFLFACVETSPPYLTSGYLLGSPTLEQGETERREALNIYARCLSEDRWPGYNDDRIEVIDLPNWAWKDE
jgi:exodeoxyribonuclease VIII